MSNNDSGRNRGGSERRKGESEGLRGHADNSPSTRRKRVREDDELDSVREDDGNDIGHRSTGIDLGGMRASRRESRGGRGGRRGSEGGEGRGGGGGRGGDLSGSDDEEDLLLGRPNPRLPQSRQEYGRNYEALEGDAGDVHDVSAVARLFREVTLGDREDDGGGEDGDGGIVIQRRDASGSRGRAMDKGRDRDGRGRRRSREPVEPGPVARRLLEIGRGGDGDRSSHERWDGHGDRRHGYPNRGGGGDYNYGDGDGGGGEGHADLGQADLADLDEDSLRERVHMLHEYWKPPQDLSLSVAWANDRFDLTPGERISFEDLEKRRAEVVEPVVSLYMHCDMKGIVGDHDAPALELKRAMGSVLEVITFAYHLVEDLRRVTNAYLPAGERDYYIPPQVSCFRFAENDFVGDNDAQNLIIYMLRRLSYLGYRRRGDMCYRQIMVTLTDEERNEDTADSRGVFATHAWELVCTIEEFIYSQCDHNVNVPQWRQLTSRSSVYSMVLRELTKCQDMEFPVLSPDRHVWAYRTGIYHAEKQEFYRFGDPAITIPDWSPRAST